MDKTRLSSQDIKALAAQCYTSALGFNLEILSLDWVSLSDCIDLYLDVKLTGYIPFDFEASPDGHKGSVIAKYIRPNIMHRIISSQDEGALYKVEIDFSGMSDTILDGIKDEVRNKVYQFESETGIMRNLEIIKTLKLKADELMYKYQTACEEVEDDG